MEDVYFVYMCFHSDIFCWYSASVIDVYQKNYAFVCVNKSHLIIWWMFINFDVTMSLRAHMQMMTVAVEVAGLQTSKLYFVQVQ